MEIIESEEFDEQDGTPLVEEALDNYSLPTDVDIAEMMKQMDSPVELMKNIAVKMKLFLDRQIEKDIIEKGRLSGDTRRWAKDYTELLEKIQKGLFGEKSVNLHLHQTVSNSAIASKIRKHQND